MTVQESTVLFVITWHDFSSQFSGNDLATGAYSRVRPKMPSHVFDRAVIPQSLGRRLELGDLPELVNLAQTAEVLGLSKPQVRRLIQSRRLEHVLVGQRPFVPKTAIPRFIADNTVQPWREETPALVSVFSKSEVAFTSAGPKQAAAGSAARARQIANRLKLRSPSSCASGPAEVAPEIRQKSS